MGLEIRCEENLHEAPRLWSRHQVVLEAASEATFAAVVVDEEEVEVVGAGRGLVETKAETAAGIATWSTENDSGRNEAVSATASETVNEIEIETGEMCETSDLVGHRHQAGAEHRHGTFVTVEMVF